MIELNQKSTKPLFHITSFYVMLSAEFSTHEQIVKDGTSEL